MDQITSPHLQVVTQKKPCSVRNIASFARECPSATDTVRHLSPTNRSFDSYWELQSVERFSYTDRHDPGVSAGRRETSVQSAPLTSGWRSRSEQAR